MKKIIIHIERKDKPRFGFKALTNIEDSMVLMDKIKQALDSQFNEVTLHDSVGETITIDLIAHNTIKECQKIFAEWGTPESKITDAECLEKLQSVLDDRILVEYMNDIDKHVIKVRGEK